MRQGAGGAPGAARRPPLTAGRRAFSRPFARLAEAAEGGAARHGRLRTASPALAPRRGCAEELLLCDNGGARATAVQGSPKKHLCLLEIC